MEDNAIDPWTNIEFSKNRSNQKFECKENQIRYNNEKAKQKRNAMATINKTLNNNRNVLQSILGDRQSVQRSRDFLLGAGYHFGISTHSLKIKGILWNCVYEYGITKIADQQFKISKTA
ncbi:hypothetical protein AWE51_08755 [Aquimarina aggregata]|uniref:Uncharacterized protein n=1 Tax=Aquimarina aggregata TaxID=1642818 RepID=A0A162ZDL5_9FLAO|nr:hypothetical protein [Aquimarina aggregata]KZS39731.1 hypothetical protein AWE51_08755 [Aquimarina aggregata]